jgi:hypothetical protein
MRMLQSSVNDRLQLRKAHRGVEEDESRIERPSYLVTRSSVPCSSITGPPQATMRRSQKACEHREGWKL